MNSRQDAPSVRRPVKPNWLIWPWWFALKSVRLVASLANWHTQYFGFPWLAVEAERIMPQRQEHVIHQGGTQTANAFDLTVATLSAQGSQTFQNMHLELGCLTRDPATT